MGAEMTFDGVGDGGDFTAPAQAAPRRERIADWLMAVFCNRFWKHLSRVRDRPKGKDFDVKTMEVIRFPGRRYARRLVSNTYLEEPFVRNIVHPRGFIAALAVLLRRYEVEVTVGGSTMGVAVVMTELDEWRHHPENYGTVRAGLVAKFDGARPGRVRFVDEGGGPQLVKHDPSPEAP